MNMERERREGKEVGERLNCLAEPRYRWDEEGIVHRCACVGCVGEGEMMR